MSQTLSVSNFIDVQNRVVPVSPRPIEFNLLLISTDTKIKDATPQDANYIEVTSLAYAKAIYDGHDQVIEIARNYFGGVKYATKTPEKLIIRYFDPASDAGALDKLLTDCKENIAGWNLLGFYGLTSEQQIEAANWQNNLDDDSIMSFMTSPKSVVSKDNTQPDPLLALNKIPNICKIATDNPQVLIGAASHCGCLDFDKAGGRVSLAYRQFPNIEPEAFGNADYFKAIESQYNIYATISANNYTQKSFQDGSITGERKWMDSWAGAAWIKASIQQNVLQTFGLNASLPANQEGFSELDAVLVPIMEQYKSWGGASPNMTLDEAQKREILQNISEEQYNTLQAKGYVIAYKEISPLTRTNRDFIDIYIYWLDAGVIQKMKVYSYEVQ